MDTARFVALRSFCLGREIAVENGRGSHDLDTAVGEIVALPLNAVTRGWLSSGMIEPCRDAEEPSPPKTRRAA